MTAASGPRPRRAKCSSILQKFSPPVKALSACSNEVSICMSCKVDTHSQYSIAHINKLGSARLQLHAIDHELDGQSVALRWVLLAVFRDLVERVMAVLIGLGGIHFERCRREEVVIEAVRFHETLSDCTQNISDFHCLEIEATYRRKASPPTMQGC